LWERALPAILPGPFDDFAGEKRMSDIVVLNTQLPSAFRQLLDPLGSVGVGVAPDDSTRALVVTPYERIDAAFIEALPAGVGLLASLGVGLDHVDLEAARARGIAVSNTPVVTDDTADFTMALLLAACRRMGLAERRLRAGDWGAGQGTLGIRVTGKTLGIVGFGAIGQAVARRASGFGMKLQYWGPRRKPDAEAATGAAWCATLETLLGSSDVVSLNCPLSAQTRHLIDAARLAQMRRGAVLVNTGRGPLVDEAALVDALRSGARCVRVRAADHAGAAGTRHRGADAARRWRHRRVPDRDGAARGRQYPAVSRDRRAAGPRQRLNRTHRS
jgi:glyoxylate reductase